MLSVTTRVKADTFNFDYILYIPERDMLAVSDAPWYVYNYRGENNSGTEGQVIATEGTAVYDIKYNADTNQFVGGVIEYPKELFIFSEQYYFAKYNTRPTNNGIYVSKFFGGIQSIENTVRLTDMSIYTNVYNQYQAGDITYTTVQQNISVYVDELAELNSVSGNTLADLMAINNSLTYAQTVQDVANKDEIIDTQTVTANVANTINGKINEANQAFQDYSSGEVNQTETVKILNQYITQVSQLITPESTAADIAAVNAAVNTIEGIKDSVGDHSDLQQDVAESVQKEDEEELQFLEELTGETTATIDDLQSGVQQAISDSDAQKINDEIITPILDNVFLKRFLPIAALFMVVCVVLGIRYRL